MDIWELAIETCNQAPSEPTSAGAVLLTDVLFACAEVTDWNEDSVWEVAELLMPIYDHEVWDTFVDLGCYADNEQVEWREGLTFTEAARVAVFDLLMRSAEYVGHQRSADWSA